nr:tubby-related protein 1-like isoform X2 [Ipomoea batatas]
MSHLQDDLPLDTFSRQLISPRGSRRVPISAHLLRDYDAYRRDVEAHIAFHIDDIVTTWFATEAGRERIAFEGLLTFDVGQYAIQRDLYAALRQRDKSFDIVAWGLLPALDNPDLAATAESAQPADATVELRSSSVPQSATTSPT